MSAALAKQVVMEDEATLDDVAMCRLGLVYSTGQGGEPVDYTVAHKWFNLAAMRGNQAARNYRAELALEMSSEDIAEAQRMARQWLRENNEI